MKRRPPPPPSPPPPLPFKRPGAPDLPPLHVPQVVTQRAAPVPMTLSALIARLTDLREVHGGTIRVVLRAIERDLDGNVILSEPSPEVVDLAEDWPDAAPWFAADSEDMKVVIL